MFLKDFFFAAYLLGFKPVIFGLVNSKCLVAFFSIATYSVDHYASVFSKLKHSLFLLSFIIHIFCAYSHFFQVSPVS